jgi:two-component system cell cycle sensor histidine kinase/response regulator CckA
LNNSTSYGSLPVPSRIGSRPSEAEAAETGETVGTVLLVEDEPAVRSFVKMALRLSGWDVLEAGNALDAIALCERHEGAIRLLVSDLLLPDMSGRQLAETLLAGRQDMKVLYLSGHTQESAVAGGILDANTPFLHKPFSLSDLAEKVRETMNRMAQATSQERSGRW